MARVTSAWTDRHGCVAAALVAAALAGGLATRATGPYAAVGLFATAVTVLAALALDALGGLVAGLAGAALVIAARQLGGDWDRPDFPLAVALTGALLAAGWSSGLAGRRLRQRQDEPLVTSVAAPAYGSLGLLPADLARGRLEEEIARARRHRRPLTVVLVRLQVTDERLSDNARRALERTVARLVESLVPETAVPFALAPDQVGAILPEVDEAAAWEVLGPIVDAATRASFSDREEGERRSVVDCTELQVGLAPLTADLEDADRLLTAVRRSAGFEQPAPVLGASAS